MPMSEYVISSAPLNGRSGHRAGRELLSQMYAAVCPDPMPDIVIAERGKPCFSRGPWHFSISHTHRRVFCALSRSPIGIDAEELDRPIRPALAEKILSAGEMARFRQADDPRIALLTFWVLKEASAKFSGEGLRGYPCHTDFRLDDPRVFRRDQCLLAIITN